MTGAKRAVAVLLVAGVATFAVGCGSDSSASGTGTPSTPVVTETTPADTTSTPALAAGTVSANDASADEITAALEANGVENADRWTREVMEYRPYPTDDPTLAELRKELQKYNPSPEQLELIMGALTP